LVLDARCGTGNYFRLIAAAGHRVIGVDQSAGRLQQARARGIADSLAHLSLQDLSYVHQFDAVLTIDAMENVSPEDSPAVLANLHRALRPGGLLYMTVEGLTEAAIQHAVAVASARASPAARRGVTPGYVAGDRFHP